MHSKYFYFKTNTFLIAFKLFVIITKTDKKNIYYYLNMYTQSLINNKTMKNYSIVDLMDQVENI